MLLYGEKNAIILQKYLDGGERRRKLQNSGVCGDFLATFTTSIYLLTIINGKINASSCFDQCSQDASSIITALSCFSGLRLVVLLHLSAFLFIFHANFGHFIPDNYDLVGVGGADGGVGAWGGRGGRGGVEGGLMKGGVEGGRGGEAFTPRLLIPLLKGFCSIMPDSFRK